MPRRHRLCRIALLLPSNLKKARAGTLSEQVRVLGSGRLLIVFAMTALGYGGTFVAFTFLASILQEVTGFSASAVSLILVLYGLAIAVGNVVGGRIANRDPVKALTWLFVAQAIVLVLFSFTAVFALADDPDACGARLPVLRQCARACSSMSCSLREQVRPAAVDVASALNIAAFNLGIAAGAWIGGLVVQSSLGLGATPWVGAILVAAALVLTLRSGALDRRSAAEPDAVGSAA